MIFAKRADDIIARHGAPAAPVLLGYAYTNALTLQKAIETGRLADFVAEWRRVNQFRYTTCAAPVLLALVSVVSQRASGRPPVNLGLLAGLWRTAFGKPTSSACIAEILLSRVLDIRHGTVLYLAMGTAISPRGAKPKHRVPLTREGTLHGCAEYHFNRQTGSTYRHAEVPHAG